MSLNLPKIARLGWLAFALALANCQPKQTAQRTLSDEQLAAILADLAVAESACSLMKPPAKDSFTAIYAQQVFDLHGISKETFERNFQLAVDELNLDRMKAVYKRADDLTRGAGDSTGLKKLNVERPGVEN